MHIKKDGLEKSIQENFEYTASDFYHSTHYNLSLKTEILMLFYN